MQRVICTRISSPPLKRTPSFIPSLLIFPTKSGLYVELEGIVPPVAYGTVFCVLGAECCLGSWHPSYRWEFSTLSHSCRIQQDAGWCQTVEWSGWEALFILHLPEAKLHPYGKTELIRVRTICEENAWWGSSRSTAIALEKKVCVVHLNVYYSSFPRITGNYSPAK